MELVAVYLQISALRLKPVLNEVLWIVAEAQHEVSLGLQLVDGLDRLMDLQGTQKPTRLNGQHFMHKIMINFQSKTTSFLKLVLSTVPQI